MEKEEIIWKKWQQGILIFAFVFLLLFILTASEPTRYIPNTRYFLDGISEWLVNFSARYIFQIKYDFITKVMSDSIGLWVHVFNLGMIAGLLSLGLILKFGDRLDYHKIYALFLLVIAYYLAFQMLFYGFNKVFKCQFFLPEPNILYTPVGETSKDLLFWTVMGSSYGYTVFGGCLELLAAFLLLNERTRLLGALVCMAIMSNVVAINFCFNISVKFYSTFFLCLALVLIIPYAKSLYYFFIRQEWYPPAVGQFAERGKKQKWIKFIVVWALLFEVLAPYAVANNFNDDLAERPLFHGAYEVEALDGNQINTWSKVFVHRRGYFIVQDKAGKMQDYHFWYDTEKQVFQLEHTGTKKDYFLHYTQIANTLLLNGAIDSQVLELKLIKMNLNDMPLLKSEFHWTIDAISK